jgi:hypothetical protein
MRTDENSDKGKKLDMFHSELLNEELMRLADAPEESDGIVKEFEQKKRDDDWHNFETV